MCCAETCARCGVAQLCSNAANALREPWDDAVEGAALEVERLAALAHALLAGTESAEVLGSLRDGVRVQLVDDPEASVARPTLEAQPTVHGVHPAR